MVHTVTVKFIKEVHIGIKLSIFALSNEIEKFEDQDRL